MRQLREACPGKWYERVGADEKRFAIAKCVRDRCCHDVPAGNAASVGLVLALEKDEWVGACT
jgi:hypothetical protein